MTAHILILCTHNSARSVLAEGMLNHWAARLQRDGRFLIYRASFERMNELLGFLTANCCQGRGRGATRTAAKACKPC